MPVKIPISEARKKLSEILKDVSTHQGRVYEITVNDIVFGEIHPPASKRLRVGAGEALITAAGYAEPKPKKRKTKTAREHNEYLYPQRINRGRNN